MCGGLAKRGCSANSVRFMTSSPCAIVHCILHCQIARLPDWIAWNMEKDETINDPGCGWQGFSATFFDKPLQPLQMHYWHIFTHTSKTRQMSVFFRKYEILSFMAFVDIYCCHPVLMFCSNHFTIKLIVSSSLHPPDTFLPQRYITMAVWPIGVSASFHQ